MCSGVIEVLPYKEEKHVQESVRVSEIVRLKAEREMSLSSLRVFCRAFQSDGAAHWNDARPREVVDLGIFSWM